MAYLYTQGVELIIEAGGLDTANYVGQQAEKAIKEALAEMPQIKVVTRSVMDLHSAFPGSEAEKELKRRIKHEEERR